MLFRLIATVVLACLSLTLTAPEARAFCGFYVAKADGELFNKASKVVFTRAGNQSTITMSSDYRGAAKDFALIVPTPRVLRRHQIGTVKAETVAHLDAYSAPRLVEYHDWDPCAPHVVMTEPVVEEAEDGGDLRSRARAKGVTIAAEYAVGTHDVVILKANQSDGLATFLTQEGYQLPDGAEPVLARYISAGMKFFVARVNLERHAASETKELPPLQIAFLSRHFMLPIQLGKLNADGPQDALFFMLSRKGRVEPANYRLSELPSNIDVPIFVERVFGQFYKAVFNRTVGAGGGIVLEYAWDMAWCDPCAADPLSHDQLRELGVTWLGNDPNAPQDVYVTRLHAQYTKDQMPEDVMFRETDNRNNFQGRYIMNHPHDGDLSCEYGEEYLVETRRRLRSEAVQLGEITGWKPRNIEDNIRKTVQARFW